MARKLVLSVTLDDCETQTFRSGGKGGQNQNKRDTGVRVIHHPSGARGESREERSQLENKRRAFVRMANTVMFRAWAQRQALDRPDPEAWVKEQTTPDKLRIEVRDDGKWKVAT